VQLPTVEAFVIESSHVGDRLEVSVALPPGCSQGSDPLPAVYVLDPVFNFQTTMAATAWLATASRLAGGGFPPTIVVGVGYPTDDLGAIVARRARDLTPTVGRAPEGLSLPPFPLGLGGAARFLDALAGEVMPQVEARHPADPADRTLVGHSFGGLFALFTLFGRPAAFRRYLVVSPSIWWDDRVILVHEQGWADEHADLPARVFVAVGRDEQAPGGGWKNESFPDEAIASVRQVDNFRELCTRLEARRYPGLNVESVVLDGEYHLTVGAAAITRGLISLFSSDTVSVHAERVAGASARA
jgi:predicted alpha/beta superfamily hydrolase